MDMNVVYLTCVGPDVHKKSMVAAICVTNPVTLEASYFFYQQLPHCIAP